jgi:mediator of RNA polymerase II transcription subunit 21
MSSDVLTQLQTCYDQLLTQFFSTVSYLTFRHPLVAPTPDPSDPFTNPPPSTADGTHTTQPGAEDTDTPSRVPYALKSVDQKTFEAAQNELAEDLVLKGQQIEDLIRRLPGLGRGEDEQAEEIKLLVERVREMERRRKAKRKEMRVLVRRLEDVVMGMATSIDYGEAANGGTNGVSGHG